MVKLMSKGHDADNFFEIGNFPTLRHAMGHASTMRVAKKCNKDGVDMVPEHTKIQPLTWWTFGNYTMRVANDPVDNTVWMIISIPE